MCAELEAERRRLLASLAQSADENAALRASALLWIDLYERQLRRANGLAETARPEPDRLSASAVPPSPVASVKVL